MTVILLDLFSIPHFTTKTANVLPYLRGENSLYYTWIVENLAYLHSSICAVENIATEEIIDSLFPFERNQLICCNFSIILFLLMKNVLRHVCYFSIILYCMWSTKKTEDLYFASQTIANVHHLQTCLGPWQACSTSVCLIKNL